VRQRRIQHAENRGTVLEFIRPSLGGSSTAPDCGPFSQGDHPYSGIQLQRLGVSAPLLGEYAQTMEGAPDPTSWTSWIDEAFSR